MVGEGVAIEVMDLEVQVAAVRERHSSGEIGAVDLEPMIKGARAKWARDHPPPRVEAETESASPRAEGNNVNLNGNEGARVTRGELRGAVRVNTASVGGTKTRVLRSAAATSARSDAHGRRISARQSGGGPSWTENASTVRDGGIAPEYGYFKFSPDKIVVSKLLEGHHDLTTWVGSIEPQFEIAQLKKFVDGTVEVPPKDDAERRAQFHSAQLLTFMVISRCCSPVVQAALKPCSLHVDAGFQAWRFIMKTHKAMYGLYIGQQEQRLTNLEMGEHGSAIAYCNRAQQILAALHMAGVDYSMSLYVTHVIKGLPVSHNLLRRMVKLSSVREELDEDTLLSYIIEEEFTLESERRKEQLLPQVNYVASKQMR
ncbi:unnamed protein product [Closterium sp. NIES-54]